MNDKKKDFQSNQSDIHTIVDLPMEAVIAHITQISSEKYWVEIRQKNSDEASFRIRNKLSKNTLKLDTIGTIRRWNGTFTRLDAKFNIRFSKSLSLSWLLGFGVCLIFALALSFGNANIKGLMALLLAFIMLFAAPLHNLMQIPKTKPDYEGDTVKQHNDLIHGLVDELNIKLKQKAVMLDFDGSEDNLAERLQEAEFQHFRIGADGEIASP